MSTPGGNFEELLIQELGSHHRKNDFSSDEPSLDDYLRRYARQNQKKNIAKPFVASPLSDPEAIVGYYTLSMGSVSHDDLPREAARKIPRYPVPVAMLGRLAVDARWQGKGIGKVLLADAAQRVVQTSSQVAVYALVVDALHEKAAGFYRGFHFIPFPSQPMRLFLPLETVAAAMDATIAPTAT